MPKLARAAPIVPVPGPLSLCHNLNGWTSRCSSGMPMRRHISITNIPCRLRSGLIAVRVGVSPPVAVAIGMFPSPILSTAIWIPGKSHDRLDPASAAAPALAYDHPHVQQHQQPQHPPHQLDSHEPRRYWHPLLHPSHYTKINVPHSKPYCGILYHNTWLSYISCTSRTLGDKFPISRKSLRNTKFMNNNKKTIT